MALSPARFRSTATLLRDGATPVSNHGYCMLYFRRRNLSKATTALDRSVACFFFFLSLRCRAASESTGRIFVALLVPSMHSPACMDRMQTCSPGSHGAGWLRMIPSRSCLFPSTPTKRHKQCTVAVFVNSSSFCTDAVSTVLNVHVSIQWEIGGGFRPERRDRVGGELLQERL